MPNNNTNNRCLHCKTPSNDNVQVRCDECDSFICRNCHWCHEFQGNHEIRVCGYCDVFYCKDCDEMDQCDDCHETVCGSCSTLLSCKFCGGGLCEECATACGRCGIVLCRRDAKFAVECDTCRLSYCLVCLAATPKDPCVRCGQRPSKRMEQLVHLRLKSIYKAFSSTTTNTNNTADHAAALRASSEHDDDNNNNNYASSSWKHQSKYKDDHDEDTDEGMNHHQLQEKADAAVAELLAELEQEEEEQQQRKSKKKNKHKKKPPPSSKQQSCSAKTKEPDSPHQISPSTESTSSDEPPPLPQPIVSTVQDPLEEELATLLLANDVQGLERLLASVKGVPGRGAFRKNAKKALKRIRAASGEPTNVVEQECAADPATTMMEPPSLGPEEMLRLISDSKRSRGGYECVMHMAPSIVGWVIGKGGQRIRDMMDESGARIWIDQDSMSPTEPRIVYVSGQRGNVDDAITAIQELIAAAPAVASPRTPIVDNGMIPETTMSSAPAIPETEETGPINTLKPRCKTKLTCEPRYVPLLIGRRGWTIKNIQDTTGAKVDIDQTVSPRQITISGREDAVEEAKLMVEDVLSYPHAHPLESEENHQNKQDDKADQKPEAVSPQKPDSTTPPTSPIRQCGTISKTVDATAPVQRHDLTPQPPEKPIASPPSSLIMNSDAKSTVSISSSLSSTPEPSSRKSNPTVATTQPPNGFHTMAPPPQSPMVAAGSPMYHASPFPNQMQQFMSSSPHISPRHHVAASTSPPPAFARTVYPVMPSPAAYMPPPYPMGAPIPPGWNPALPPPHLMTPQQQQQRPFYGPPDSNGMLHSNPNHVLDRGSMDQRESSSLLQPRSLPKELGTVFPESCTSDAKVVDSLFGDDSSTKELILSGLKGLGLGGGTDSDGLWTAGAESSLFSSTTWGEPEG